ncbi:MAG TPA: hypothetical protein V6C71_26050 [Coleofasciculaceae cyanobacterium]|jgi:hypothetical protein
MIDERHSANAINQQRKPLGRLIGAFKTVSTKKINILRDAPGTTIWQSQCPLNPPSLGDFKLSSPPELGAGGQKSNIFSPRIGGRGAKNAMDKIRQYIVNNPLLWDLDRLHPDRPSKW